MSGTPNPAEKLEVALAQVESLLAPDPALATQKAEQILATAPGHPVAALFLGIARRFTGDAAGLIEALEPLGPGSQRGELLFLCHKNGSGSQIGLAMRMLCVYRLLDFYHLGVFFPRNLDYTPPMLNHGRNACRESCVARLLNHIINALGDT